ncbi:MAG: ABC transporter ATP-binding protein [Rhizobiales bacterium]|nr:ABC transporter ATP-binding protein [Hyphomicrobiales bacterium]
MRMSEAQVNIAADRKPWAQKTETPFIQIKNISKKYDGITVLDDVSIDIYKGEFFGLLGGSGSGKTTLLRVLAGFEQPDQGDIIINGTSILNLAANRRPINMMFQSYALFPHMNVRKNISFGLEQEKLSKAEIAERVAHYIHLVQLDDFANRKPQQLSGGQRQRVALARCLIKQPEFILLDEPMAALDNKLREQTQFELVALQEQLGLTMMVVTHDQKEAMALSTRIGVMQAGKIEQIGEPQQIYNQPKNHFVANFIGAANFFSARIKAINVESQPIAIDTEFGTAHAILNRFSNTKIGQKMEFAIRPEYINMHPRGTEVKLADDMLQAKARVEDVAFRGENSVYRLKLNSGQTCMVSSAQADISWDQEISISWQVKHMMFLMD